MARVCGYLPDHRRQCPPPCRLIAYRQWLLAYRIAGVLKNIPGAAPPTNAAASGGAAGTALAPAAVAASVISQDAVLVQWACAKISASVAAAAMDDAQLKVRHSTAGVRGL